MKKSRFYVVRHGQSEGNIDLTKTEQDPPLTTVGINQAKKRAIDLEKIEFNSAYSSNLSRAVQTTQIITENRDIPHTIYEDLREREYGNFFARSDTDRIIEEINAANELLSVDDWWHYQHIDGSDIETYISCFSRFYNRVTSIALEHPDEIILLVSHGDLMRSLLVYSNYGDHRQYGWEAVQNTGYIIMDVYEQRKPEIIKTVDIIKL